MGRRPVLTLLGIAMALLGGLFLLQGLGIVRWPASSFMIDQRPWVINGSVLAVLGLVLVLIGRRVR